MIVSLIHPDRHSYYIFTYPNSGRTYRMIVDNDHNGSIHTSYTSSQRRITEHSYPASDIRGALRDALSTTVRSAGYLPIVTTL